MTFFGRKASRVKVDSIPETEADSIATIAAAYQQNGQIAHISFWGAWKVMLNNSWMGLSSTVPNPDVKDALGDNFVNVGVVAALLFTMVSIDADVVGEELVAMSNGTISLELCADVYSFMASVAWWLLFMCVMFCLTMYCIISELSCQAEVIYWQKVMGPLAHVHFILLVVGMLTFGCSHIWLLLTKLAWPYFLSSLLIGPLVMGLILLYANNLAIKALYGAKAELKAQYAADKLPGRHQSSTEA